jgi:hypothetical protein
MHVCIDSFLFSPSCLMIPLLIGLVVVNSEKLWMAVILIPLTIFQKEIVVLWRGQQQYC